MGSGETSSNRAKPDEFTANDEDFAKAEDPAGISQSSIFRHELAFINARRSRGSMPAEGGAAPDENWPPEGHTIGAVKDLSGLAFSGGGIRASTFCLGVAQAMARHGYIDKMDYLSTVSGGGYFGTSLTTTLTCGDKDSPPGRFCFNNTDDEQKRAQNRKQASSADKKDSPAVGHLRNYSNYLVPNGFRDFLGTGAIIARGLAANLIVVLGITMMLAAMTAWFNPTRGSLAKADLFGFKIMWPPVEAFAVTLVVAAIVVVAFYAWALRRSANSHASSAEVDGWEVRAGGALLILLAVAAFFELQPFAINWLFGFEADPDTLVQRGSPTSPQAEGEATSLVGWISVVLPALAAFVAFFRNTLKQLLEDTYFAKAYKAVFAKSAARLFVWVGALALPLLIWFFYLNLSVWSIANTDCITPLPTHFEHSPNWLTALSGWLDMSRAAVFMALGVIFFLLYMMLRPNAYSLHFLYRDRLSKAFHFDPNSFTDKRDPKPFSPTLKSLRTAFSAPYHLVNTAVNLYSSKEANRRGRNADFFIFSPMFLGSRATGYVSTLDYRDEAAPGDIKLETVMAISGAAASSNMGSQTIRALSPTLALLNIRLGYWLTNPRTFFRTQNASGAGSSKPKPATNNSLFFLWAEMFGFMSERDARVYLTDGGHIENLGIYELLRRRCKLIIAVDAETDPQMRFGSLITLQIYARIDLGIHIDLPFAPIREATLSAAKESVEVAAGKSTEERPAPATQTADEMRSGRAASEMLKGRGPHVAIGRIDYGDNKFGTLIYIKASLTGDENDYIRDYVRRNPSFPHEATGDQFFTEEQFEVYRALGFHIADRFFSGEDWAVAVERSSTEQKNVRVSAKLWEPGATMPDINERAGDTADELIANAERILDGKRYEKLRPRSVK